MQLKKHQNLRCKDKMEITSELLNKYNKQGPRYTSYPPATFFTESFTEDMYRAQLIASNSTAPDNISLYFHIPFCQKLCHFCGCHSIGRASQESLIDSYIDAMIREIETVGSTLSKKRKVSQIHWGGGTPHSISDFLIGKIMNAVYANFDLTQDVEIAMECNPAYTDLAFFDFLKSIGFTRISLGIQDFNAGVLKLINRDSPKLPLQNIVDHLHELGISVNFDLIYGLPGQRVEHFYYSLSETIKIRPDRIATFSYAHVPWMKKSQAFLEKYTMPDPEEKFTMLLTAYNSFSDAGFIPIGMDHFALSGDELEIAQRKKRLHRNFQGYTTKDRTGQVYAFGVSGISQLTNAYSQNTKNTSDYIKQVNKSGFATSRGYILSDTEKIIREVITEIMCNSYLNFDDVAYAFSTTSEKVKQAVAFDKIDFSGFIDDSLLTLSGNTLTVTEAGSFFIRNIAMAFDPQAHQKEGMYSKTV